MNLRNFLNIYEQFQNQNFSYDGHILKEKLMNLSIFEFIISSDNLAKYLELILNHVIFYNKKVITEKILNSDSLIIDYKFNKILFNYIPKESTEFEFLSLLLKKGLLNLSRKDKNSRKYYE